VPTKQIEQNCLGSSLTTDDNQKEKSNSDKYANKPTKQRERERKKIKRAGENIIALVRVLQNKF